VAEQTAVTIGFFDGVHRGHQALLARTVAVAAEGRLKPVAVTFDLHRFEVLQHHALVPKLSTTEEKVELLRAGGAADVTVLAFTPEFAQLSGREFVTQVLIGQLGARHVVVGRDFRFGHDRACGLAELQALGRELDLGVEGVEPVLVDGERVSSNAIRRQLLAGEVAAARRLLGRPYSLAGPVVAGRRLGRTIGFPTANLAPDPRKVAPAVGVYAAWAECHGGRWPALVNFGVRPTVEDAGELRLEAHLLSFEGDLYDRWLTVGFVQRLRGERHFDSVAELARQIERDRRQAKQILG